jgi:heme-degrading monooxygenase HmoA
VIVRRWRASATNEKRYLTHFRRRIMPQLEQFAGYRGALVLRRHIGMAVEIEVLTFWTSMASIRRFAGRSTDRAMVADEAKTVLRRFDSRVVHLEVTVVDGLFRASPARAPH